MKADKDKKNPVLLNLQLSNLEYKHLQCEKIWIRPIKIKKITSVFKFFIEKW